MKTIKRSAGRTATAVGAYRAGERIECQREGRVHDYTRKLAEELVSRYGVAVDVAIHAPHREGDQRNHHAHVLTSTRKLEAEGFTAKTRVLDHARTCVFVEGSTKPQTLHTKELGNFNFVRSVYRLNKDARSQEYSGLPE